ncbi:MAG: multiheme c-type cytochrome [Endozoicomonas sp.]
MKAVIIRVLQTALLACLLPSLQTASAKLQDSGFTGSKACASCHQPQYQDWFSSQHRTALQQPQEDSVFGDFNDSRFLYNGVTSRFFREKDQFLVQTDGPDGQLKTYKVKYTIGDYPLQQYLIEYQGGRLQTLGIAWDTRPQKEGGQRWIHLYPDQQIEFSSPFHWTSNQQNANLNCLECHTTGYQKNYDEKTSSYHTQWQESGAGCESCHGSGQRHIDWASGVKSEYRNKGLAVDLSDSNLWHFPRDATIAQPLTSNPQQQIETCGQCHSRRQQIAASTPVNKPLTDSFMPELLRDVLYEDDGQIKEEVFVYGSFKQSKMFQAGVTCSNCHNPHSNKLKAPGNQICAQCHLPSKYDTVTHTFHKPGTRGSQCVDCHMPEKTFMVVDPRRDHSFKTPRPDLSVSIGSPNACVLCHTDKDNAWAATSLDGWLGKEWRNRPEFGTAFHAAKTGTQDAIPKLEAVIADKDYAPMIRASALDRMEPYLSTETLPLIRANLKDPDPLVRLGALGALNNLPVQYKPDLLLPLLDDKSRMVRQQVGKLLADVPATQLSEPQRAKRQTAVVDYIDAQRLSADRAPARMNLGQLYRAMNQYHQAEAEYLEAIRLEPYTAPAYVNLADLYRHQGRQDKEQNILQQGLGQEPGSAELNHAMGLLLVRQKQYRKALVYLKSAADFAPGNSRYVYVYGVALHTVGDKAQALEVLRQALRRFPQNAEIGAAIRAYTASQ